MDKKTLVIVPKMDMYYFSHLDVPNTDIMPLNNNSSFLMKSLIKFNKKFKVLPEKAFYAQWYRHGDRYGKIVIFDYVLENDNIIKDILSQFADCERYIYFWNIIPNNKNYDVIKKYKSDFRIYDYDVSDCENYGLKFNTIMYDKSFRIKADEVENDMFFLGFPKDKTDRLVDIYNSAVKEGLNPSFTVVGNTDRQLPFSISNRYVNYKKYIEMLCRSKAILDLTQKGQHGFSMRVMESIFHDKKIISDNEDLLSADFYDESRIYVMGTDKRTMREFLEIPLVPYSEQTKDYYSFEKWLERFQK